MFEHLSIIPRRYGEDAVRRNNRLKGLEFMGTPEFEELFTKVFGGLGDRVDKPRVYSIRVPDRTKEDIARTKKMHDDFHWKIDDADVDEGEDDEPPYIHEQDVVYAEDEEDDEDDEPAKVPSSIFEMLSEGKKFSDIVPTQPKHTEIYNQAFGLDDNGDPIPLHDDEEDDEVKDPYVFIANRLTFLIQTIQPIIFDTSIIETGIHAKVNYMSIAVNTDKTYPKIETENDLAFIMREFNGSKEIQDEINEFLKDTEYDGIWAFPSTIVRNDVKIPAIRFVIYPKRKSYSFGPAFLNRNK
jgi:hypothetical protein